MFMHMFMHILAAQNFEAVKNWLPDTVTKEVINLKQNKTANKEVAVNQCLQYSRFSKYGPE